MPHIPDSRHADHDPLLVAAYAAGDATGPELDEAQALVAACGECAALHHDLRAIAAALPALPAPVRPRDFRLTPEQAATLRPAGWRRLLAPLAGPRFAFAGPLGTGLATLGIAGLLVAGSLGAPLAATPTGGGTGAPSAAMSEVEGAGGLAGQAAPADGASPLAAVKIQEQPSAVDDAASMAPAPVLAPAPSAAASAAAGLQYSSNATPDGSPARVGLQAPPQAGPVATPLRDAQATTQRSGVALGAVLAVASVLTLAAGLVLAGLRLGARRVGARG